jgi:hypothetical protein
MEARRPARLFSASATALRWASTAGSSRVGGGGRGAGAGGADGGLRNPTSYPPSVSPPTPRVGDWVTAVAAVPSPDVMMEPLPLRRRFALAAAMEPASPAVSGAGSAGSGGGGGGGGAAGLVPPPMKNLLLQVKGRSIRIVVEDGQQSTRSCAEAGFLTTHWDASRRSQSRPEGDWSSRFPPAGLGT